MPENTTVKDLMALGVPTNVAIKLHDKFVDEDDASDGGDILVTSTGATTARALDDRFADILSVKDFGAVGDGTDATSAFNAAAAAAGGGMVRVPRGTYLVSSAVSTSALWVLDTGAIITGLANVNVGRAMADTSRLTGRIIHCAAQSAGLGFRFGDSDPWLERDIRGPSEGMSELVVLSSTGQIALQCGSRSSDNLAANFATIGLSAYGVNDNTTNPEPSWSAYLEARRSSGAGAAYNIEADSINTGNTFDLDPYTTISNTTGQTVNLWVTNGGGDISWAGNTVSAGMALHGNPAKFLRGIVIRDGALDTTVNEAMAVPVSAKIAWYSSSGVLNSSVDHRQLTQTTLSDSSGLAHTFTRKRANGTTATASLDRVQRAEYYGYSGSASYLGGYTQVLQRAAFSGGNARFSYDITARNDDGTESQVSLNGLANKSFAPFPDNTISSGTSSFRWSKTWTTDADVSGTLKVTGNIGFYGTTPAAKPTVTGSRGGNAALASIISALAALGLVTDSSTA